MKHLSEYLHSVDLVRARPAPHVVLEHPEYTLPSVLAVEGEDYSIYLADCRESDAPGAGKTIRGEVACDFPEADYEAAFYAPLTGLYSPWLPVRGGPNTRLLRPQFTHDIVLRIQKRRCSPASRSGTVAE